MPAATIMLVSLVCIKVVTVRKLVVEFPAVINGWFGMLKLECFHPPIASSQTTISKLMFHQSIECEAGRKKLGNLRSRVVATLVSRETCSAHSRQFGSKSPFILE